MNWRVIDDAPRRCCCDDSPHTLTKQNQSRLRPMSVLLLFFFTAFLHRFCYLFFHSIKIWIFTPERKFLASICINAFKTRTHAHTWQPSSSLSLINYTFFLPPIAAGHHTASIKQRERESPVLLSCLKNHHQKHSHSRKINAEKQQSRRRRRRRR